MENSSTQPNENPAVPEQPEELLYHYTDQAGLDGILSSGCMWATHYSFLNDASERKHGLSYFKKAVDIIYKDEKKIHQDFRSAFKKTLENYFQETSAYYISFTSDNDEIHEELGHGSDRLSQWRGYASDRQGYCLAFDRGSIADIADSLPSKLELYGKLDYCLYKDEEKEQLAIDVLKPVYNALLQDLNLWEKTSKAPSYQPFKGEDSAPLKELKKQMADVLVALNRMKHDGFKEEHETRLFSVFIDNVSDSSLINFRGGKNGQIPFIQIPVGIRRTNPSLQRIVIGPSSRMEQLTAELRLCLQQLSLANVEVVPSKIPYRNW